MKSTPAGQKLALRLSYVIAGVLALLPLHALLTTWLGSNTGHLDLIRIWKEVTICLVVVPTGWLVYHNPKLLDWFKRSWIVRLMGLYALLHVGLGIWALHAHHVNKTALVYSLIINLRFFGFFLVCASLAALSGWLYKHWLKILLAPAVAVVAFGLLQRLVLPFDFLKHFGYGPKTIPAYQTVDSNIDYRRIQSTLRGANPLAAYLNLVIPASFLVRWRPGKYLFTLGLIACLFFSYSRSAWIGVMLSLGFLAWLQIEKRRHLQWLALAAVLAAIAVGGGLYIFGGRQSVLDTLLHTSSHSTSAVSSNAQRSAAIIQAALEVWHQPLGRGPGTAGPASFRNNAPRIADNYYLQIGQEVGLIGIALFLLINLLVARQLWAQKHTSLAAILLASLIGIS